MQQAAFAKQQVQIALARGKPIPAPFDDPPVLNLGEHVFYKAWFDLDKSRISYVTDANRVPRITREQVRQYLEWYKWDDDIDFMNDMFAHIQAMEDWYIPYERKKLEAADKRRAAEAKRKNKRRKG